LAAIGLALAGGWALAYFFGWVAAVIGFGIFDILIFFAYARAASRRHERAVSEAPAMYRLKGEFSRWRLTPRLAPSAERALGQLESARLESARFRALLSEKLSPGELTYARWQAAAEDFERAFWRCFEDLAEAMSRAERPSPGQEQAASQMSDIETRLAHNEEGLAKMREARAALAGLASAPSETDYATALKELESIAQRAQRLAASQRTPDASE
jgi:hypothetical protein